MFVIRIKTISYNQLTKFSLKMFVIKNQEDYENLKKCRENEGNFLKKSWKKSQPKQTFIKICW